MKKPKLDGSKTPGKGNREKDKGKDHYGCKLSLNVGSGTKTMVGVTVVVRLTRSPSVPPIARSLLVTFPPI